MILFVVIVSGKSRALKYIARADDFDEDEEEYEWVFWQKVNSKILLQEKILEEPVLIVNEEGGASFASKDIVPKRLRLLLVDQLGEATSYVFIFNSTSALDLAVGLRLSACICRQALSFFLWLSRSPYWHFISHIFKTRVILWSFKMLCELRWSTDPS